MKIKFSKKELKELKETQKVLAKKAKDPNFLKTLPEAIRTVDSWKI